MNAELSLDARVAVHAALGEPVRLAIVDTLRVGDASPGELGRRLHLTTNLLAHHLNVLEDAGVVVRRRSDGDHRRTYLRLVSDVLDELTPTKRIDSTRVVFVCTRNSARSQLAAAMWPHRSRVPVACAGTDPADRIHPRAVRLARRHGHPLDDARTAHVSDVLSAGDLVVVVCDTAYERLARDRRWRRLHWSVPSPDDNDLSFESVYADLAGRIEQLVPALEPGASA